MLDMDVKTPGRIYFSTCENFGLNDLKFFIILQLTCIFSSNGHALI